MGHNVWQHIRAVQDANVRYDQGILPGMLVHETFERKLFRDVVEQIFEKRNYAKSMQVIEDNSKFWDSIIGTRGFTGKKIVNSASQFNALFN